MDVREEELQDLYMWVDGIPLSRPKKNIARDFSDGGMCDSLRSALVPHLLNTPTLPLKLPSYWSLHPYAEAPAAQ